MNRTHHTACGYIQQQPLPHPPNPQGGVTPIDYSHSCDRTQSTVKGQRSNRLTSRVNGQSGIKKMVNVQIPVQNGPDYSAVICSEPVEWGYTCTESLFPDIQAHRLGLQLEYQDSFAGKISEWSKVNGQKLAWSTVKPPKIACHSFDPRSQL